ncbi:hypothetical protein SB748_29410 [Rhizobium sp. SIMBA_035]
MTNIRAKGFSSQTELNQYLDDIEEDRDPNILKDGDEEDLRAAEKELAWLHKEVADLRDQLSLGHQRKKIVSDERENRRPLIWVAATLAVSAVLSRLLNRSG